MSRFFGTQICQWQVITGTIVAAHQPLRAISSSESGSRGFWISSSEQADVGHSDILSISWNFSHTNLSLGSGQSECGRSFQGSGVKGVVHEASGGQQDTQVDHASLLTISKIFLHMKKGQESRWINALVQW